MDGELHSLLVSGLTDVFRTVAICQAKLAAGTSIDGQGYLLQVHCICEELHPVCSLTIFICYFLLCCNRTGDLATAEHG